MQKDLLNITNPVGKINSVDCMKCGKLFSNERNLATHVSEVHDKEIQIESPLCIESVYLLYRRILLSYEDQTQHRKKGTKIG